MCINFTGFFPQSFIGNPLLPCLLSGNHTHFQLNLPNDEIKNEIWGKNLIQSKSNKETSEAQAQ
jgi:hypothetical protein